MEIKIDFLSLVFGAIFGFIFAYLLLRARYHFYKEELNSAKKECEEKANRLQELESELRYTLEGKARAEQEAKRIPELEKEIVALREENVCLKTEIAEIKKERDTDKEKIEWLNEAQNRMRDSFQALASQILKDNTDEFLKHARSQLENILMQIRGDLSVQKTELRSLVEPLENTLKTLDSEIKELERRREGAYQGLQEQLRQLAQTHTQLQKATINLVQALKSPTVRGKWGEYQLRRIVEMAGMVEHVDFEEQASTIEGRPDMIIYLPNEGILPVDAKTPMQAYLEAIESNDEQTRQLKLTEHARAMRERVKELGQKQYWRQFGRTPEFVVMFVPNDACLSSAFEYEPDLFDFAIEQKVFPATPVNLLALLKAVAYGWQQHQIAKNAIEIAKQGRELYERLNKFLDHMKRMGEALNNAVRSYNEAVGSLESRLFPSARKFKEFCGTMEELKSPNAIDHQLRIPLDQEKE